MTLTARLARRSAGALVLVLALVVGPGAAHAQDPVLQKLIKGEAAELWPAGSALDQFERQLVALQSKSRATPSEVDALRRRGEEVKRALPAMQRGLSGMVTKLRSARLWTPEFDSRVIDQLNRAGQAQLIREITEEGGARAVIQGVLTEVNKIPTEIDQAVAQFRGRTTVQRLLDSVLGSPAEAKVWATIKKAAEVVAVIVYCGVCGCVGMSGSSTLALGC